MWLWRSLNHRKRFHQGIEAGPQTNTFHNLHSFKPNVKLMKVSWLRVWNLISFQQRADYTLNGVQTFQYVGLSRYWENIFLGFFRGISILQILIGLFNARGNKIWLCGFLLNSKYDFIRGKQDSYQMHVPARSYLVNASGMIWNIFDVGLNHILG